MVTYGDWQARDEVLDDVVSAGPAARLAAALGVDPPPLDDGDPLPPLWHWLLFLPTQHRDDTAADGHLHRGGFLPPLPHRRRMFAGGRLTFSAPLQVGARVQRHGHVVAVEEKTGRSGDLVVVTVRYEISGDRRPLLVEEQDLVYSDASPRAPTGEGSGPPAAPWSDEVTPDEVLLFRFSALTYNAHRIHYDRPFAAGVDGYPDLVTHGPLTAILLAEMIRAREAAPLATFAFRAMAPLYAGETIRLRGTPANDGEIVLTAHRPDGTVAMEARATLG